MAGSGIREQTSHVTRKPTDDALNEENTNRKQKSATHNVMDKLLNVDFNANE